MYANILNVRVCWIDIFSTVSDFSFFYTQVYIYFMNILYYSVRATAHGNWHVDDTLFALR